MLAMVAGVVLLLLYRSFQKNKTTTLDWRSAWWLVPYAIGLTLISYFGDFGGGHAMIPFGIDFIVIAGFSLVIMYLAMSASLQPSVTQQTLPSAEELNITAT